jgi:hypothetical protein
VWRLVFVLIGILLACLLMPTIDATRRFKALALMFARRKYAKERATKTGAGMAPSTGEATPGPGSSRTLGYEDRPEHQEADPSAEGAVK